MKIIKRGIVKQKVPTPEIEKYWWQDCEFRCKNCECVFKLQEEDYPHHIQMYATYIRLTCPDCEVRLNINKPTRKNKWPDTDINNQSIFEEIFGENGVFHKIFGEKPFKR